MNRQEISENIEIARRYLNSFHLLLPDDEVLFDCYCLPSFRQKAFYAQVSVKNGVYRASCAYTRYADHLGNVSCSRHFTAIEKDTHSARKNDIICKIIFPKPEAVDRLLCAVKKYTAKDASHEQGFNIDGITTGIRHFENGNIVHDIVLNDPDEPEPLLDEICSFSDII